LEQGSQQIRGVSALKKIPYKKSAQQIGEFAEQKILPIFFFEIHNNPRQP